MLVELLIVVESNGSDAEACASQRLAGTCGGLSSSPLGRRARNIAFNVSTNVQSWYFDSRYSYSTAHEDVGLWCNESLRNLPLQAMSSPQTRPWESIQFLYSTGVFFRELCLALCPRHCSCSSRARCPGWTGRGTSGCVRWACLEPRSTPILACRIILQLIEIWIAKGTRPLLRRLSCLLHFLCLCPGFLIPLLADSVVGFVLHFVEGGMVSATVAFIRCGSLRVCQYECLWYSRLVLPSLDGA